MQKKNTWQYFMTAIKKLKQRILGVPECQIIQNTGTMKEKKDIWIDTGKMKIGTTTKALDHLADLFSGTNRRLKRRYRIIKEDLI